MFMCFSLSLSMYIYMYIYIYDEPDTRDTAGEVGTT